MVIWSCSLGFLVIWILYCTSNNSAKPICKDLRVIPCMVNVELSKESVERWRKIRGCLSNPDNVPITDLVNLYISGNTFGARITLRCQRELHLYAIEVEYKRLCFEERYLLNWIILYSCAFLYQYMYLVQPSSYCTKTAYPAVYCIEAGIVFGLINGIWLNLTLEANQTTLA